jgi:hypothetical protein
VEGHKAIDIMAAIHAGLEKKRGSQIPDWSYRDVLFMLIYYSIAAYELLEHKLTDEEKQEVYDVFYRMGTRMGVNELPPNYQEWLPVRNSHLENDLEKSSYTEDLFKQYKKHLGNMRFRVLIEAQKLVVPERVKQLLQFSDFSLLSPVVPLYKVSRLMKMDWMLKKILLPGAYQEQIRGLDREPNGAG